MKTFSIDTLGCKINQYESQQIRQLCEQLGLNQVDAFDKPDLIAVNTCCVTHTASAKSRRQIRKSQKQNPDAAIVVFGCLPAVLAGELTNLGKNIYIIKDRQFLAGELAQIINNKPAKFHNSNIKAENKEEIKGKKSARQPKLSQLTLFKGHTRAFLKVQDGCDGYCSYCIVPKARPKIENKPIEEVLKEAQALVNAGHKEIVVTGVFLGAYGQETVRRKNWTEKENRLAELLEKLAKVPGLARIRLSSLEPADVMQLLLDVMCENRNIMPHLHLSLQSGSDEILRKMGRQYGKDEFYRTVELIKRRLDRPAITGDFIVGFPSETDEDFEQTVEVARKVGFSRMHVFPFSARQGTAAAKMQGFVKKEVIKARCEKLRRLGEQLAYEFREQFIGEIAEILVEDMGKKTGGKSERYFTAYFDRDSDIYEKNQIVRVKLLENRKDGMFGEVI
jgi:threonylcarbamoyladenosine tRNA methylthiotransferase MtaB